MTHQSFIDYFNREDQLVLEEGLIKTYPAEAFEHALKTKFKDCIKQLFVDKNFLGLKTKFELHLTDTSKLKEMESFADTYGYHFGAFKDNPPMIQIEPKFPFKVFKNDLPKKAFHITRNEHLESILKHGLTPKDSKTFFKHPGNRIYLFVTKSVQDVLVLKELLRKTFSAREQNVGLSVLEIDLWSEVYYLDPNLEPKDVSNNSFGIFTLRNISPELIRFVPELSDNSGKITKSIEDFKYQKSLKHE